MKKWMAEFNRQDGIALPMAIVLMFIVAAIATPVVLLTGTNLKIDAAAEDKTKGTYAADAGIQYAVWKFTSDESYIPGDSIDFPESATQFGGYNVSVQPYTIDAFTYKIVSTATNETTNKSTEVVAYLSADESGFEAGPSAFDYSLVTLGGNLTMSGSSSISCLPPPPPYEGDVWVNGNITLGWSNYIYGTATLTGTLTSPNPQSVKDGVEYGEPMERPAWLDEQTESFIDNTIVNLPSFGGTCATWTDVAGTYNNPVCVNGNMTLAKSGTYTFNDTVHVTGNLIIQSGVNHVFFNKSVKVDGYVQLQGNGDVTFGDESSEFTIPYNSYPPSTINGVAISTAAEAVSAVLTVGAVPTGGTLNVKLQDADSAGGPWIDVDGASFISVDENNDSTFYSISYSGGNSYIRAVAEIEGQTIPFSVSIVKTHILYIGGYLYCGGSRSAMFESKISVLGNSTTGGYAINFDGSKYSGVAWDVVFKSTIRASGANGETRNVRFGSGRSYTFYDVIYATGNVLLDGNAGSMSISRAIIADGSITVQGSSGVGATSYAAAPYLISRKVGGTGVSLSGSAGVTAIIYSPDSHVYVSGSSQLSGALVSKSAQLDGNVQLKYPVVLRDRGDLEGEGGGEGDSVYSLINYSAQ